MAASSLPWPDPNQEISEESWKESTEEEPDLEEQQRRLDYNSQQCARLKLLPRESIVSPQEYKEFAKAGYPYGPPVLVHYPPQLESMQDRWTAGQLRKGRYTALFCSQVLDG